MRFREGILNCIESNRVLNFYKASDFPCGACDWTCKGLARFLREEGVESIEFVKGERATTGTCETSSSPHIWVRSGEIDIDITLGQFFDAPNVALIETNSDWHRKEWSVTLLGPNDCAGPEMGADYAVIAEAARSVGSVNSCRKSKYENRVQERRRVATNLKNCLFPAGHHVKCLSEVRPKIFEVFRRTRRHGTHDEFEHDEIRRCFRQMQWRSSELFGEHQSEKLEDDLLEQLCTEWRCWNYAVKNFSADDEGSSRSPNPCIR